MELQFQRTAVTTNAPSTVQCYAPRYNKHMEC